MSVVRLILSVFAVSLMLSTGLPSATCRISRTARCTGGAMYRSTGEPRLGLRFSRMHGCLAFQELDRDTRNFRRLLLADRMAGVADDSEKVARRGSLQRLVEELSPCGRSDMILVAVDDRGRHPDLCAISETGGG